VHSGGGQVGGGVADSEYGGGMSDEGKPKPEAAAPCSPVVHLWLAGTPAAAQTRPRTAL
jgi:hypothetical protein